MEELLLNAVVREIWTALIKSVICGMVLAVAVRLMLAWVLPGLSAATRFAVWFVALAGVAVMPLVFLVRWPVPAGGSLERPQQAVSLPYTAVPVSGVAPVAVPVSSPVVSAASEASRSRWLVLPMGEEGEVFLILAAMVSAVLLLRLMGSYWRVRRLKSKVIEAPPEAVARFAIWRKVLPTSRPVQLLVSRRACSPMAVGFLKPAILIPESLLLRLTVEEFDHLGLHELAHIRRGDDWTNLAERFIQAIFFFHPAVHYICSRLEFEREAACDDQVVAITGEAKPYARSLAKVLELAPWRRGPVLASGAVFRKRQILQRIEALFDGARNAVPRVSGMTVGIVALCVFGALSEFVRLPDFIAFAGLAGGHSRSRWSENGKTVEFETVGEVHFSLTDPVIEGISPGGFARLRESGWTRRELEVTPDPNGGALKSRYLVDGREVPMDARGKEWSTSTLSWVIRESGSDAEERAMAIHAKLGVTGVLDEVDKIRSGHVRRKYLATLMESAKLDGEETRRVMSRVSKMESDHDKAEFLLSVMDKGTVPEARVAYFDAVSTIRSDHDHRRVLGRVLAETVNDPAVLMLVARSANGIESDHDKAELLRTEVLAEGAVKDAALRKEYLKAAGSIRSSHDKSRVLEQLAERSSGNAEAMQEIVRVAGTIESDHDRGKVLKNVISQDVPKEIVASELLASVEKLGSDNEKADVLIRLAAGPHGPDYRRAVRSIGSDHDKERVLKAMLERGAQPESAKAVVELVAGVSGDHEKAELLLAAAGKCGDDPAIQGEIRKMVEKIGSDSEYRRVMSKLFRKD